MIVSLDDAKFQRILLNLLFRTFLASGTTNPSWRTHVSSRNYPKSKTFSTQQKTILLLLLCFSARSCRIEILITCNPFMHTGTKAITITSLTSLFVILDFEKGDEIRGKMRGKKET